MTYDIKFTVEGWEDFLEVKQSDKKLFTKLLSLIEDSQRNGYGGIGHPEPLKENFSGFWSKEINRKNRFVYKIEEEHHHLLIIKCIGHYDD